MDDVRESEDREIVAYQVACVGCHRTVYAGETELVFDEVTDEPAHACPSCVQLGFQAYLLEVTDPSLHGLEKQSAETIRATLRRRWEDLVRQAGRTMCQPDCRAGCDFVERMAFAIRDWQDEQPGAKAPTVASIAAQLAMDGDHFRRQLRRHTGHTWRDVKRSMSRDWLAQTISYSVAVRNEVKRR